MDDELLRINLMGETLHNYATSMAPQLFHDSFHTLVSGLALYYCSHCSNLYSQCCFTILVFRVLQQAWTAPCVHSSIRTQKPFCLLQIVFLLLRLVLVTRSLASCQFISSVIQTLYSFWFLFYLHIYLIICDDLRSSRFLCNVADCMLVEKRQIPTTRSSNETVEMKVSTDPMRLLGSTEDLCLYSGW